MWGGKFNPIIPIFKQVPSWWDRNNHRFESARQIINGYLDFFEPDFLVEASPGLAEGLGFNPERILPIAEILTREGERDREGHGLSVLDLYEDLYRKEFRFVSSKSHDIVNVVADQLAFSSFSACLFGGRCGRKCGNTQTTVSVFNGQQPLIRVFENEVEETAGVAEWLKGQSQQGVRAFEMAVFVRSEAQLDRARSAVRSAGLDFYVLDDKVRPEDAKVSICTMHLAKGLEFRVVVVMACDEEVVPLQSRIANIVDSADLGNVYNTERYLLYVACTRARDRLMIAGVTPVSEFLGDLGLLDQ